MPDSGVFISADDAAIRRFVERFDLGRFEQAGCVFEAIQREGDSFRLSVKWSAEGADFGRGAVSIGDGRVGDAFLKSRYLAISFVGQAVTRPFAVLMASLAARAGHMTIEDLFSLTGLTQELPEVVSTEIKPTPYNPILEWGSDDSWRHFTCDAAMARRFQEAFEFDSSASFIVHGDLECRFVSPGARLRIPGFFEYPFDLSSHNEGVGPVTDLSDQDVIVDSTARIETKVMQEIAHGACEGPVVIISTCVPVVIAEDPAIVLARLAQLCPGGISYVSPVSPEAPSEIYMKSFAAVREAALRCAPEDMSVGMVGYRPDMARTELQALLSMVGISVRGGIVPLVTHQLLAEVLAAKGILVAPSHYHTSAFEALLDGAWDHGRIRLEPAFPWGFDGTRRWLEGVAEAFDVKDHAESVYDAEMRRVSGRINECRLALNDSFFLFICDIEGINRLFDPLSEAGLAALPTMCDLGLKSRVLLYAADDGAAVKVRDVFHKALGGIPSGHLVESAVFSSEADLSACLQDDSAAAVYSEMGFDYRATHAGRPTFSTRIFEPGIEGGLRTILRFRRLAGLPYYRRYSSLFR